MKTASFDDYTVSNTDGIKILNQTSWGLIRPSNTSPKITLRFESSSENGLKIIKNEAPSILNWLDALQTTQLKNTEHQYIEEIPADLDPLLEEIGRVYLPYLCKNVDAVRSGKKYFEFNSSELNIRKARFSQYRVWCLKELREKFYSLSKDDQSSVEQTLRKFELLHEFNNENIIFTFDASILNESSNSDAMVSFRIESLLIIFLGR